MITEFITTTGTVTLKNKTLWQKRIIAPVTTYWWLAFGLMLFIFFISVDEALAGYHLRWVRVLLVLVWSAPFFKRIYRFLFISTWTTNIHLSKIKKVSPVIAINELEEKVVVTLRSGREKEYYFRRSEAQAESFTQLLLSNIVTPTLAH